MYETVSESLKPDIVSPKLGELSATCVGSQNNKKNRLILRPVVTLSPI